MLKFLANKVKFLHSPFHPSYFSLGFNFSSQVKPNSSPPDEFLSKEKYLQKLTEQREKEEKEEDEQKKLHELYANMKKREYEVSLSSIDYAKIRIDNINAIPKESFQTVDELFYFLKTLPSKVSEENIVKCLDGLLNLSEKIKPHDLENIYYKQFISIIDSNINLISEPSNYVKIARFLDLFCVSSPELWEKFERKILARYRALSLQNLILIFQHFSNQKEGSDHFYDRCEEIFQAGFDTMTFDDYFLILEGYFNSKYGTKAFIEELISRTEKSISGGSSKSLIKLAFICNNSQNSMYRLLTVIETQIIKKIESLTFDELCNAGIAFGDTQKELRIFKILEEKIMKDLKDVTPLKVKQILEGLAFNYKGSKQLMLFLKPKILEHIDYFSPTDLAKIVKSLYILEVDVHDEFFRIMEKKIVTHLKDLKNVKNEELMEFVRCYCVTRNGSREFYKLLELVISYRFKELVKNVDFIEGMYKYYSTSGLCSPELLKQFEAMI